MNDDEKIAEAVAEERRLVMIHVLRRYQQWVGQSSAMGSACVQLFEEIKAGEHLKKEGA